MASNITSIQVKEQTATSTDGIGVISVGGSLSEHDRRWGEAAIDEARVQARKVGVRGQEISMISPSSNTSVSSSKAVPSLLHGDDVAPAAMLRQLLITQRYNPSAHVVPDSSPRPIVGGVMVGGAARARLKGHGAMATKAPGQLRKADRVDVQRRRQKFRGKQATM